MKKITLAICACLLSVAAFALAQARATGTYETSCGETWSYVVHYEAGNNQDKINRIANLMEAAENACQAGTGETSFIL